MRLIRNPFINSGVWIIIVTGIESPLENCGTISCGATDNCHCILWSSLSRLQKFFY